MVSRLASNLLAVTKNGVNRIRQKFSPYSPKKSMLCISLALFYAKGKRVTLKPWMYKNIQDALDVPGASNNLIEME